MCEISKNSLLSLIAASRRVFRIFQTAPLPSHLSRRSHNDRYFLFAVRTTQVWFQNRRAKWKKRKKTTNVFRTSGSLLPSHGLPPFGTMGSDLCGAGMFHTPSDRWGMGTGQILIDYVNRLCKKRDRERKREAMKKKNIFIYFCPRRIAVIRSCADQDRKRTFDRLYYYSL